MSSFLGRAGPLVLARFVSACLTTFIPLVLARALSLEDYGTYKQLFLIATVLYHVLPFGVAQSLYYFAPRVDERRPFFGQTLLFLAFTGALAAVALWALGPKVALALNNPALMEHRLALALFAALGVASFPLELSMTSQGKTGWSAVAYLASDGLRAAALVLPALFGLGLSAMMGAMVAWGFARLLATWWVMLTGSRGPLFDRRLFVSQLVYAAPFGMAVLFAIPQQYAHQFAVSAAVTPALFAVYAVGCFNLPLVDLLYSPTSEVLMVRLGELDKAGRWEEGARAFREAASRLAYLFLPMSAFFFAAAPEFIEAVFGARFLGAVPIFRVTMLMIPLAALPMDGTLRARGATRYIFASYGVKALVTVPLVYFGVRWAGMLGGIGSWALAELVGKAMLLLRVPSALSGPRRRVSVWEVVPWRALRNAAGAAALAALSVFALRWASRGAGLGLPPSFGYRLLSLAVAGLLFSVGYLLALRLTGVRPAQALAGLLRARSARRAAA